MAVMTTNRVNEIINIAMDGRTNRWLKEKLADKRIILSDSQISQRLNGLIEWTGNEALHCFEILNIDLKELNA